MQVRIQQQDGTFFDASPNLEDMVFLSSFANTVPFVQQLSWKLQAKNAVTDPLSAIKGFLYESPDTPALTTTNALTGRTVHAPLKLSIVRQILEEAYSAHLEDYKACDCPTPYSKSYRKVLRNASYNWLGFMWMPGVGHHPREVLRFMYSS